MTTTLILLLLSFSGTQSVGSAPRAAYSVEQLFLPAAAWQGGDDVLFPSQLVHHLRAVYVPRAVRVQSHHASRAAEAARRQP